MGDRSLARALGAERCTTDPIYSKLPLATLFHAFFTSLLNNSPGQSVNYHRTTDSQSKTEE